MPSPTNNDSARFCRGRLPRRPYILMFLFILFVKLTTLIVKQKGWLWLAELSENCFKKKITKNVKCCNLIFYCPEKLFKKFPFWRKFFDEMRNFFYCFKRLDKFTQKCYFKGVIWLTDMWSLPQGSITISADRLGECSGEVGFFYCMGESSVLLEHRSCLYDSAVYTNCVRGTCLLNNV